MNGHEVPKAVKDARTRRAQAKVAPDAGVAKIDRVLADYAAWRAGCNAP